MNHLIAIPMFVPMTRRHERAKRRKLAPVCSATVLLALIMAALFGGQLLDFFAIDVGSFRITGSVIVLLMGLTLMHLRTGDDPAADPHEAAVEEYGGRRFARWRFPCLQGRERSLP